MNEPGPICEAFRVHKKASDARPGLVGDEVRGSLGKSLRCGCEYCMLACNIVCKRYEVAKYQEHNREAVARNSESMFFEPEKPQDSFQEAILPGEISKSGLGFKGDPKQIEVFVVDRADDPILPVANSVAGDTGSKKALRTAWKWFEECVKGHDLMCPNLVRSGGPPRLPFRVVDVGTKDYTDVRLVQSNGEAGYWACLSHCWGGEQPLQTTRDTLERHQNIIPWMDLPKTFQDAVSVARVFGIPYLWIDSLCIVQDDLDDWQAQSTQMADIYQNSILTIAGSASSGPNQGIFRKANPGHVDRPITDIFGDATLEKVRFRQSLSHKADDLPLLSRGWVHQERLLSPRVLHFGHNELVWECMQRLTCECGYREGRQSANSYRLTWPAPKELFHPYSLQLVDWWNHRGPSVWQLVVADYSHMALSKPEDIFPAISGLAKSVQKVTGWEYIAGLWKDHLLVDLVWRTEHSQLATRCVPWRAPTFSWASVQSRTSTSERSSISYGYMDALRQGLEGNRDKRRTTDFYATLMETSCTHVMRNDPTGRVHSAYIILKGTLIRTTLCRSTSPHKWYVTAIGKEPREYNLFEMDFNLDGDGGPGVQPEHSQDVRCLRLIGTRKHVQFEDEEFLVYMVLRQVKMENPGAVSSAGRDPLVFERIGLLANRRGEVQLEDESDANAISHEMRVKIV